MVLVRDPCLGSVDCLSVGILALYLDLELTGQIIRG
jgi:hypothetical protein